MTLKKNFKTNCCKLVNNDLVWLLLYTFKNCTYCFLIGLTYFICKNPHKMDGYIDISNSSHSEVWKYFLKNKVQNRAKCKECNQIYEIKSGSTTNLRSHLRTRHNVDLISSKKLMDISQWNSLFFPRENEEYFFVFIVKF